MKVATVERLRARLHAALAPLVGQVVTPELKAEAAAVVQACLEDELHSSPVVVVDQTTDADIRANRFRFGAESEHTNPKT